MKAVQPSQIKLKKDREDSWIDPALNIRITLERGRYKPTIKGTHIIVGGLYSMEAAKEVCCIVLNDYRNRGNVAA